MKGKLLLLALIIAIASVSIVSAATIHGTVYTLDLEPASDAIVEINTNPNQILLALNGTYSFNVPQGDYILKASIIQEGTITDSTTETVRVTNDGSYIIDLLLFPEFGELDEITERTEKIDESVAEKNNTVLIIILVIIALVIIALIIRFFMKKIKGEPVHIEPEEPKEDLAEAVLEFIKKQEGRTTQKEIRQQFPHSEAKISLVVAELVHKEKIEKIKKGRSNIIILK